MRSSLVKGVAVFVAAVVPAAAHAGTLVFPQGTATWGNYCNGSTGLPPAYAENSSGCGTNGSFRGGQFIAPNGLNRYSIQPNAGFGCSDTAFISFNAGLEGSGTVDFAAATSFSVAIDNIIGNGPFTVKVTIEDVDPNTGFGVERTQLYPLGGTAGSVSGAGYAISSIAVKVCNGGDCSSVGAYFDIADMSATQPVRPTVELSARREADGTYSAVMAYQFPPGSDPGNRNLSLRLLPDGQDDGMTWSAGPPISTASGTWVQSLGALNTDRTLLAVAYACNGNAYATASVSGCSQCNGPPTSVGPPVRLFDGAMTYSETDPLPATIGSEFRREYSTMDSVDGRFGRGWSSVFDASALPTDANNDTVVVVNEDRTRATFVLLSTGDWLQSWPKGGARGTLTGSEASGYTYRDASGSLVRTFGTNHRLVRIQDLRRARAVSIAYDAAGYPTQIFDERGQWSCTVTTAAGHVTSIAVDGRPDLSWTYGYNGALLTSVTPAGAGAWRTYEYASNLMTAVRDAAATLIEGHTYDANGRAVTWTDASGDVTNIQYPASDANGIATTTVTRADNSQATYEQAFAGGAVVTRKSDGGCSSCGSNDATAVYDANGNLVRLQDARGYVTRSVYDAVGRRLVQTTTAMVPSGCDPTTDAAHCRLSSDALAAASLATTSASQTTSYTYGDPNWLSKPTQITRDSVIQSGGHAVETFTFDAATGEALAHTIAGAIDSAGTQESHTTTTALYGASEAAAFDPGGAFQSAWLSLPQPAGEKKSVDGPRTDVTDVTMFVYYPIDNAVPGPWRGHLAAVRNALGQIARYQDYDVFGHATTAIDPNGVTTRAAFDVLGRPLSSTIAAVSGCDTAADPLCATDLTATRSYASVGGPLASEQRPAGNATSYVYDSRGRVQTLTRGTASTGYERIETTYDLTTGKKSSETLRAFQNNAWVTTKTESYAYTSDGHLSSVTHADNTKQLYTYLPDGTLASVQDENHATPNTVYDYDPAGRLSTVTQTLATASGGQIVTRYAYDTQGNLTSVTDPNGNVTTYVYDDFRRMRRQTSPVSGVTTYTYDAAGNVLTTTDANGATTTRTYDALNRVLSAVSARNSSSETVSWTYDDGTTGNFGIGRLATLTDPTGSTVYRYERRGLLRSEAKTIAGSSYTTTYAYDANGNRSTMNYPNGIAANYTFDFADRPYSLSNGAASIVSSATYLPFGPMSSLVFGNGTTRTMSYDTRYRPLENKLTGAAGTIADYTYAEDNTGNITQIHDAVDARYNRDFGYDDLNRLTTANSGSLLWGAGSYSYDAMGNMLSSSLGTWKTTSSSLVGTTPKLNAVVENGTSRAVTYDAAGNETTAGSSSFTYSPRNSLVSADTSAYVYDGRGVLTIATISVLSLSVAPSSVTGGTPAVGAVTLSAPAATDTTISLVSTNPAAGAVPASIVIAAGATAGSFSVGTSPVSAAMSTTITATFNQYSASAPLTVLAADLASVTLSPPTLVGGNSSTGTVTLTGPAATSVTVTLTSNNGAATVPSSLAIPAGSSSGTFSVTTTAGVSNTTAVITATMNGSARQATLTFVDADLDTLTVSPSSIVNGATATGTVTLNGQAAGPVVISLSASTSDVYPASSSVTVPTGATSATFSILGTLQSSTRNVTITATHGAVIRQTTITVQMPWVTSFTLSPQTLIGGDTSTATASINGSPQSIGTYSVSFTSTNTNLVPAPKAITFSSSPLTGQTKVFTNPVASQTPVIVTANDPSGSSTSQTLTLQPPPVTLSSFTATPTSLVGSNPITATITLTGPAPAGGLDVDVPPADLSLPLPLALQTPGFVRVPAGSSSATFTIDTGMGTSANTNLSATHVAVTKTIPIAVMSFTTSPSSNVQRVVGPISIAGGSSATGSVDVFAQVTSGSGSTVNLSSSNTAALTVPSSVKVTKGSFTQNFTITTKSVTAPTDVVITATGSSSQTTATTHIVVLPPNGVTISQFVALGNKLCNTGTDGAWYISGMCTGRILDIGRVDLTGPAPTGGLTLAIGGAARPNILTLVDASGNPTNTITIPAGATSGTIHGTIGEFIGIDHWFRMTATLQGITRTSDYLRIKAMTLAELKRPESIQCASLGVGPCLSAIAAAQPEPLAVGDTAGYYLYTPELHLTAETEVSSATAKQIAYSYLWFGDVPVASIQTSTNTTRWYATDHLGTPYVLTDSTGVPVWRAELAPFGNVFTVRAGASLHQPLRFPGQLAMDGTETYYNVFRWYRSSWGRYSQVDPISLSAEPNVYTYADESPVNDIDPIGLSTFTSAGSILVQWLAGLGPTARVYGPGDLRTEEMVHAVGVLEARRRYLQNHCQTTAIQGTFGFHQFVAATFSLSATQHQVGSYTGSITPIQNGFALFRIDNTLSMWSFFYHRNWAPKNHQRGTPIFPGTPPTNIMSNIQQHFWWVEQLCCK